MPDTPAVIVPRGATEEMITAGVDARWQSAVRNPNCVREVYAAMLAASPNAGCVTAEQFAEANRMFTEAFNAEMRRLVYEEMMTAVDAGPLAVTAGLRAALASLGLPVATHEGKE